jgi:hypothetical protein
MFQTEDSWESQSNLQVLRSISGKPGLRQYPLIAVPVNVPLFHVDVLFKGEGADLDMWERFICYDLATTAELIEQEDVVDIRVSMQTQFVRKVVEIKCVSVRKDARAYSCICENGSGFEDHLLHKADLNAGCVRTILPRG